MLQFVSWVLILLSSNKDGHTLLGRRQRKFVPRGAELFLNLFSASTTGAVAGAQRAGEQQLGGGVFYRGTDGPAQGRAPVRGVEAQLGQKVQGGRPISSETPSRSIRSPTAASIRWAISRISGRVSWRNTMVSSTRFKNSGRKTVLRSSRTAAWSSSAGRVSPWEEARAENPKRLLGR